MVDLKESFVPDQDAYYACVSKEAELGRLTDMEAAVEAIADAFALERLGDQLMELAVKID